MRTLHTFGAFPFSGLTVAMHWESYMLQGPEGLRSERKAPWRIHSNDLPSIHLKSMSARRQTPSASWNHASGLQAGWEDTTDGDTRHRELLLLWSRQLDKPHLLLQRPALGRATDIWEHALVSASGGKGQVTCLRVTDLSRHYWKEVLKMHPMFGGSQGIHLTPTRLKRGTYLTLPQVTWGPKVSVELGSAGRTRGYWQRQTPSQGGWGRVIFRRQRGSHTQECCEDTKGCDSESRLLGANWPWRCGDSLGETPRFPTFGAKVCKMED